MCVWLYVILIGQEGSSQSIRQEKEQVLGGSCRDWTHVSAFANKPVVLKANMCFRDCKDFLWVFLSGDPVKSTPRADVDF